MSKKMAQNTLSGKRPVPVTATINFDHIEKEEECLFLSENNYLSCLANPETVVLDSGNFTLRLSNYLPADVDLTISGPLTRLELANIIYENYRKAIYDLDIDSRLDMGLYSCLITYKFDGIKLITVN